MRIIIKKKGEKKRKIIEPTNRDGNQETGNKMVDYVMIIIIWESYTV